MAFTFKDFAPLYDFSQWEKAVQAFFCDPVQGGGLFAQPPDNTDPALKDWTPAAGLTAFFTGLQSQTFQKARPRVELAPIDYAVFQNQKVIDSNSRVQARGWQVPLEFYVITKADYFTHTQFLATVRSLIAQMQPVADNTQAAVTGLNAFLTTHELALIEDQGGPSFGGHWSADSGYFLTPLKYRAIFAVRATAWPGGINQ